MRYSDIEPKIKYIHGWLNDEIREFLFNLAKCSALCAEIGSYKGLSSSVIGLGMLPHKGRCYCIDTFQTSGNPEAKLHIGEDTFTLFEKMRESLGLKDVLVPVKGWSYNEEILKQIPDHLDFVFIDGDHSADNVYRDTKLYVPKVKQNGLILYHDWTWDTVKNGIKLAELDALISFVNAFTDFGVYRKRG